LIYYNQRTVSSDEKSAIYRDFQGAVQKALAALCHE